MTVSVVVPSYNRRKEVTQAVESVLNQTYDELEVVVVDDGSNDGTKDIIRGISDDRVTLIEHEANRGVSAARNTGIMNTSGEYIAFLDSDDYWEKNKIEKQVRKIKSLPDEYVGIYCAVKKSRPVIERLFPEPKMKSGGDKLIPEVLNMTVPIHPGSTLMIRRSCLSDTGNFDTDMDRHEDIEFVYRILKNYKIEFVREELVQLGETGYPSPEKLERDKKKLIEKVSDGLSNYYDLHSLVRRHMFLLSKEIIRSGDIVGGIKVCPVDGIRTRRDIGSLAKALYSSI